MTAAAHGAPSADAVAALTPKPAPVQRIALPPLPPVPLVSIIVPSYNQGRFIRATIDSILAQPYRPLEIHVIDGGSTDGTEDVLRSYGNCVELHWTSERDRGVVEAVNKGFARCRGDIVAIQSSDDCYLPGALSHAIEILAARPDVGLVYGDTIKIDADGREVERCRIGPFSLEGLLLLDTWIPQPSTFFRRSLLETLGGWDERIPYAPDTDLWIRMAFRTKVVKLNAFLSARRLHEGQRDRQAARIAGDYVRMIEASAEIAAASPRLRRAASAGKHLIRVRYNPHRSDWYAAWHLLCAGVYVPKCFDFRAFVMLVGLPVRRLASRIVKRSALLGKMVARLRGHD